MRTRAQKRKTPHQAKAGMCAAHRWEKYRSLTSWFWYRREKNDGELYLHKCMAEDGDFPSGIRVAYEGEMIMASEWWVTCRSARTLRAFHFFRFLCSRNLSGGSGNVPFVETLVLVAGWGGVASNF